MSRPSALKCNDDEAETSEVQLKIIAEEHERGHCSQRHITLDWAREMVKNKANVPEDCLVMEMLQELPIETAHEITHWFDERFGRE